MKKPRAGRPGSLGAASRCSDAPRGCGRPSRKRGAEAADCAPPPDPVVGRVEKQVAGRIRPGRSAAAW